MKTHFIFLLVVVFSIQQLNAQFGELGLHYQPHKFHLTNPAEKIIDGDYSERSSTLSCGNSVGFFFNKLLGQHNSLQFDVDFMSEKQYYNYVALNDNKSNIYTKLNSINFGVSHNLYLWQYENDDNIFFTYGLSFRNLMSYTDFYEVTINSKNNGVVQKDTKTTLIENTKLLTTVTHNDTIDIFAAEVKTSSARYSSINVGANFGIHFLHYFSDDFALTIGAKGVYYFMDPENKTSDFWSTTSKYKFGNTATLDTRAATKMYSFGLSISLIYCIGRGL